MCETLTLPEIQKIVKAILKESDQDIQFKSLVLKDTERAIKYIIERDFSNDIKQKYDQSTKQYRKIQKQS